MRSTIQDGIVSISFASMASDISDAQGKELGHVHEVTLPGGWIRYGSWRGMAAAIRPRAVDQGGAVARRGPSGEGGGVGDRFSRPVQLHEELHAPQVTA
jgi:hypothetical protein